ncbi:hypothetical protein [Blastococcus sp. SYSU D00820]
MTTAFPPPPHAPAPTAPPAPRRGMATRDKLILGGGALALVLAGGLTVLSISVGEPDSPTEAVEQYLTAQQDGDWQAVYGLMCRDQQRIAGSMRDYLSIMRENGDDGYRRMTYQLDGVSPVDGDYYGLPTARGYAIDVETTWYGESSDSTAFVVEENGEFRVCGGI